MFIGPAMFVGPAMFIGPALFVGQSTTDGRHLIARLICSDNRRAAHAHPTPLLPIPSHATRLPVSFGCHSLGWRPRCSLRVRCRSQVGHRRYWRRRGHQHASPCIRGRASTDTARGGTSCSAATAKGISGCLFRTNAGSDFFPVWMRPAAVPQLIIGPVGWRMLPPVPNETGRAGTVRPLVPPSRSRGPVPRPGLS
jgi:hypothetical protein